MSEINFELDEPIWQVEFFHNTPETPGYWTLAVQAETEEKAIEKCANEFEAAGLSLVRVNKVQVWPLNVGMGGEENG